MNKQECFTTAVAGILKQGGPSMEIGICRYRDRDDRKCAIGFLIPDGHYSEKLEYRGVGCVEVRAAIGDCGIPVDFLEGLQNLHDDAVDNLLTAFGCVSDKSFMVEFIRGAKSFADEHGLTMPEIPEQYR